MKQAGTTSNPKLFVSYSWTSPEHEAWVLKLATELRECGVDSILDKWDLKKGHDAHAFMERMATDSDIKKVLLITDKVYADKADGRTGGVGTETQIISPEIYAKQAQDKFVAVVREYDAEGRPCVPAYYRSRIHIDFSDETRYAESFEQLIRWVYDRPLYVKPQLGQKPKFLTDDPNAFSFATSAAFRRTIDALRNGRTYSLPATVEYFDLLAHEFEKLRLDPNATPFDDAVIKNIESFLPYRNQAIELFTAIATHNDSVETRNQVRKFFESVMPYMERPATTTYFHNWDWDNFKFIVHELFLYAVAIYIRHERFEGAKDLMTNHYYVPSANTNSDDHIVSFSHVRQYMTSLESKNAKNRRLSYRADLLKERCVGAGAEFRHLQQADFVLFMRSWLVPPSGNWWEQRWFPETLVYLPNNFEIFARARSASYFERIKILLGIQSKDEIEAVLKFFGEKPDAVPRWQFESFNPSNLINFARLATES
jgi:hypothetical protein